MNNFGKKKMGCGRPPRLDTCIQNMIYTPFISKVVLPTKTQIYITENCFNKMVFWHAEYFLHFV